VKHAIGVEELGPNGAAMSGPIESCVHCGFCLPTCPTYVTMEEEMDSPRGRIFLIKEVLEGKLELEASLPYIDNCLGCQACVSACPSGVEYGDLLTAFRAHAEPRRRRRPVGRAPRARALRTLPHPQRLRVAARLGAAARATRRLLPRSLAAMVELLPRRLPPPASLPPLIPAEGKRRARVALLTGCAQRVLDPEINAAAARVLARNGVEVIVPPAQGCCGSLALHTGAADQARRLARRNLDAFPDDVDALVTTAAGCGSGIAEYGLLFAGEPDEDRARQLAGSVVDVTAFLAQIGLAERPPPLAAPLELAYQDACHLAHAQGVRSAPRELLGVIEGLVLREPEEWELCCGSAGTYNVEKPEVAAELGRRKARNLLATGARLVASGNIGCITQLQTHLAGLGQRIEVLHTIQVLDRAYSSTLEETATDD
jgi:glycolate oxidase iron-sulfur subunit